MFKEFQDFIARGNVMELAVGLIMGTAFGAIIKSFVNDIMMPPIGLLLGGVDFSNRYLTLSGSGDHATVDAAREAGDVIIAYGNTINLTITFVFTAFALFMVIKAYNNMKKKQAEAPAAPAAPPRDEVLLEEIRDLLKK